MRQIFFLIQWLAIPLYIIAGVIAIWYVYRYLRATAELQATYFELERHLARRRQLNAITAIVLAAEFALIVLGVQFQAVPYLEAERDLDQQIVARQGDVVEDGIYLTDTPQAIAAEGVDFPEGTPLGGDTGVGFIPTPTLTPTPVGTIRPNPPPTEGCQDPRAQLQIPANGMIVFKPEPVQGIAFTNEFRSAKIEIKGPGTLDQWSVVDEFYRQYQTIEAFSQFRPSGLEAGLYQFRLTIFNTRDELVAACMVNIYLTAPPQTATPTPSR